MSNHTMPKVYNFFRANERPYYLSCCAPTIEDFVALEDYKKLEHQLSESNALCGELIEVLTLAINSHGRILPSFPAHEAWVYNGVETKAQRVIAKANEKLGGKAEVSA